MSKNMFAVIKLVMMVATLLIAALGVLHVLEFFNDTQMRDMVEKTIKISAIFVGAGVVITLLHGKHE